MPADEATRETEVDGSRERTGPRHAAPRKPLFTRFHMPAGKAIASVAMPTAVLMGMGFTSTLALADSGSSPSPSTTSKSLTADEYKNCVKQIAGKDSSASPTPSASASASDSATPSPSASAGTKGSDTASSSPSPSSSDSGSGDKATPTPSATSGSSGSGSSGSGSDSASPTPSASKSSGGLLDTIGNTLGGLLGAGKDSGSSASPSPSATPSASASPKASATPDASASSAGSTGSQLTDAVKGTVSKAGNTVTDTVKNATGTVSKTVTGTTKAAQDAAASATPSPSASSSAPAGDCPAATTDQSGVDNQVPVADDPWYLSASSLLLKSADYQGIVEVKTASGTTKKVLKYVISGGTDIGDLHQTVNDKLSGKVYHVQASKGSTSTITGGSTTMYTESISGNLFGLIPITFSPDSPPPLNIPLIYFTNVKVVQAGQFGGNLHVPGMHVYTTDN